MNNRNLTLNIFVAVGATLLVNGLIFGTGLAQGTNNTATIAFAPPGWVIGAIWTGLFALFGAARARLSDHPRTRRWLTGFMVWCLFYPIISGGFDPVQGQLVNTVSLLLGAIVISRVWRTDRPAGWLLIPSLLWLCFAVILGATILLETGAGFR